MGHFLSLRRGTFTAVALLMLVSVGCSSGPRFAENFDSIPERRSASNILTENDIERYPTNYSLEQLLMHAFPSMASGISIQGMGPPLFVVNGVPMENNPSVLDISVHEISRVEVLRDAASSSLYGFRGSNGVILVSLRR